MAEFKLEGQQAQIQEWLNEGRSLTWIAEQANASRSTVSLFIQRKKLTNPGRVLNIARGEVTTEERLQAQVRELQAIVKRERKQDVEADRVLEAVKQAVQTTPPRFEAPKAKPKGSNAHVQALLLSDLHAGEVVDPEAVDGLNEYDWSILEEPSHFLLVEP